MDENGVSFGIYQGYYEECDWDGNKYLVSVPHLSKWNVACDLHLAENKGIGPVPEKYLEDLEVIRVLDKERLVIYSYKIVEVGND